MSERAKNRSSQGTRGFSLIEIIMVVMIGSILTAVAIPQVTRIVYAYRLAGAVDSVTWAIQSTRYQALMQGYPYAVVFTQASNTYQIKNLPSGSTYVNVGSTVPLSGSAVAISQDNTLQFRPNGSVVAPGGSSLTFNVSYQGTTKTIAVTNYGNVSVN